MRRRMRRREEEHENHERWAIPYGDLLTLLLAFFVVMYSISSVNAGKYRVLSDSLYAAFRGEPRTLEPIQVGHKREGSGADIRVSIVQQATLKGQPRSLLAPVPLALSTPIPNAPYHDDMPPPGNESGAKAATGLAHPTDPAEAAEAARSQAAAIMLTKVADDVVKAMSGLIKQNLVMVRRKQYWIEVEIRTDILYPSGSARLAPNAIGIIRRLADVLARFPNPIRVEGFTDNIPIRTVQFYSNWELSAARAGSVVHVLSDRGVARDRLAVVGFGDQRPVASNDTAQGRNANRRVTVVILSTAGDGHNEPGWVPNTDSSGGTTAGQPTADATSPGATAAGTTAAAATAAGAPAAGATAAGALPVAATAASATAASATAVSATAVSPTPASSTAVGAVATSPAAAGATAAATPPSGTVPAR